MAVKLSRASGNWTNNSTWCTVDSTSYSNSESANTTLTTSYVASSGFTPGAITVDGIAVKLASRQGTTGTISVHLAISGVEVSGTLVTIDVADLPACTSTDLNGGWQFFKFASSVTLLAATTYTVEAKTSSSSQVNLFSASGSNWSRALVTSTTGAPAAGDDVIVCGEYVSSGSNSTITVTMDETATTDYGAASTSLVTPAIAVCGKGILSFGTSAATNYNLKVSGNLIVYSGATFNIGSVGSEIPRDSTAVLNFDCATNVGFGMVIRNLATFNSQGLSRTAGKNVYFCKLNTDESAGSTSLSVDTDTGWLDNDEIAVASTTRTYTDSEIGALNGNASSNTLTVDGFAGAGGGLVAVKSGTSPTQSEIILLTRNVRIQGASTTLQTYIDIKATATVDCDWTEFKWMGSATANKRGIDVLCTGTGSSNFQYCSFRNFAVASFFGFNIGNNSTSSTVYSNNVSYRVAANHLTIGSGATPVVENNIFMRNDTSNVSIVSCGNSAFNFNNNTIVSSRGSAFAMSSSTNAATWTITNLTIHSGDSTGLAVGSMRSGTIDGVKIWRQNSNGILFNAGLCDNVFKNFEIFGCNTNSITANVSSLFVNNRFENLVASGDSTFSTTNCLNFSSTTATDYLELEFINCDFNPGTGIKVAHTSSDLAVANANFRFLFVNTRFGAPSDVAGYTSMNKSSFIASERHNQVAGAYKTWKRYGTMESETTTVHSGTKSMKVSPLILGSEKLETSGVYGGFQVAVESGNTVTPTVYVYEDGSYNGNRARLIVKRNDALGITSDTVLDTATAASDGAWEALSGTTSAVTEDGVLEFVVDCDGTAGNLFVDSFSA